MRILTWNIQHGRGLDGDVNLDRISRELCQLDPGIIILNEVDINWARSGHQDQPAVLQELTQRSNAMFRPSIEVDSTDGHAEYGNLILSKHPLHNQRVHRLPNPHGDELRTALEATVNWAGQPLTVFGTHLSLIPQERLAQVQYLLSVIEASPHPAIILGDFNAPSSSQEIQTLLDAGLLDGHAFKGCGQGYTFPSSQANTRIDYIFFTPSLKNHITDVVVHQTTASDHHAVLSTLTEL